MAMNNKDKTDLIFADYDTGRCNVVEAMDRVDQFIQDERRQAVEEYKLQIAIERLDVQCSEGKCKNCDSKRPLLKKLQAQLKELTKGDTDE